MTRATRRWIPRRWILCLLLLPACSADLRCDPSFSCSGSRARLDAALPSRLGFDAGNVCGEGDCVPQTVAAGGEHTCVALSRVPVGPATGRVYCFGRDDQGQLDAVPSDDSVGARGAPFGTALQLGAGVMHSCALWVGMPDERSLVGCWGAPNAGLIGSPLVDSRLAWTSLPPDLGQIAQLASGVAHNCVLLDDGATRCSGDNAHGQLGPVEDPYLVRSAVWDAPPATMMAAGGLRTCVWASEGGVYCWGRAHPDVPAREEQPWRVEGIETGGPLAVGVAHACVVEEGAALCWGEDAHGELGRGEPVGRSSVAEPVVGLPASVRSISAGGFVPIELTSLVEVAYGEPIGGHTCAVTDAGELYCWGANGRGQLGDGTTEDRASPVRVPLSNVTEVSAGGRHTCALANGELYCWGDDARGQLGVDPVDTPFGAEPLLVPLP